MQGVIYLIRGVVSEGSQVGRCKGNGLGANKEGRGV